MDEIFIGELRKALNHLYDPEALIKSPLCDLFGMSGSFDKVISMQRLFEETIQLLKPAAGSPTYSVNAQVYKFLVYRYLQQFSLRDVADELKVSQTQLYRIQQVALQDLAGILWKKFDLSEKRLSIPVNKTGENSDLSAEKENLAWLSLPAPDAISNLSITLQDVLNLLKPVLDQNQVQFSLRIPENVPELMIHPIALRQVLLNLVNALIHRNPGSCYDTNVELSTHGRVLLEINSDCSPVTAQFSPLSEGDPGLILVKQFLTPANGELRCTFTDQHILVQLILPTQEGIPILVIDDNLDQHELIRRCLRNTAYKVITMDDQSQALELAVQADVKAVLVDVLMPKFDGWAILHHIRSHPKTSHIPVIICSILPSEDLALSLSANAFLQKPFKREELIAILDRWTRFSAIKSNKLIE